MKPRPTAAAPGARKPAPGQVAADGIGANMIEAFRLAYVLQRSTDVTCGPDTAWSWLETGWQLVPEARGDEVTWSYEPMDPWHLAFTAGVRPLRVVADGEVVLEGAELGRPARPFGEGGGPGLTIGGQTTKAAKLHEGSRSTHHLDATRQSQVAFSPS